LIGCGRRSDARRPVGALHALSILGCLKRGLLRSLQCGLLRGQVHRAPLLFTARGINALRFGLQARLGALLLNGLLHTLASFFARLGARRREVTVLSAVQIRPGIQGRDILRRIVWIGLRFALRHGLSAQLRLLQASPRPQSSGTPLRKTENATPMPGALTGHRRRRRIN
jgi:hypothetical protein